MAILVVEDNADLAYGLRNNLEIEGYEVDVAADGPSGLAQARVQIDSWAKRHDQAVALANLIKARIDGAADVVLFGSNSPTDDITVQGIFFDSVREDRDDGADMFRVSQDFIVWYEER